jgi:16S rRNA G966 N2-methylase RsmD
MSKKIYVDRLFPNVHKKNLYNKLKINRESIMYITTPYDAIKITNIIIKHLKKYNITEENVIITDATAGVGGDTISFASKFKKVYSIEKDNDRFNYLQNNVEVYKFNNVKLYNMDLFNIIYNITDHDIIFFDPPWGGKEYKNKKFIKLKIEKQELENICISLFNKNRNKFIPKFIVLKLPKNYDIDYFYTRLKEITTKIYFYKLNKMIIVVIENIIE